MSVAKSAALLSTNALLLLAIPASPALSAEAAKQPVAESRTLALSPCQIPDVVEEVRCGTYNVFENRTTHRGRMLPIGVIVLPARSDQAKREPVFILPGGPGETATEMVPDFVDAVERRDHDLIFVDERGTGPGNKLDCPATGSDTNLAGYLETQFTTAIADRCRKLLERTVDLTQYSTYAAVEDLDEVRRALHYDKINLEGGSFGTYFAMMYMRAHGHHVNAALLISIVSLENRVPLYHAAAAQGALDRIFDQCAGDAACHAAYPHLREDFASVMQELDRGPVRTRAQNPSTKEETEVDLSESAFADTLRVFMYDGAFARTIPFMISQAKAGDYSSFANAAVLVGRGFYSGLRFGLNLSVTCSEFASRIRANEIVPSTRDTFLGASRVRDQLAVCAVWPKTSLPNGWFAAFKSSVPVVLVSGDDDPVTPSYWAERARKVLPNSIQLVVPGGHYPYGPCVASIGDQVFATRSVAGLDTKCISGLRAPPFKMPAQRQPPGD